MSGRKDDRNPRSAHDSGTPNPGLPDKKTIVSEHIFVSPKGRRYRIITTTEKDEYDPQDEDHKND